MKGARITAMSTDFIDDLLQTIARVMPVEGKALKELLIISGVPETTQNLRYLGFNRHVVSSESGHKAFSAVALINNRRSDRWRLGGYAQKISQIVFSPRWTRNELDLFINALRCSPDIMDLMATAAPPYSLLGLLEIQDRSDTGIFKRWSRRIRPFLGIPGLDAKAIESVAAFEHLNEIRKVAGGWRHG